MAAYCKSEKRRDINQGHGISKKVIKSFSLSRTEKCQNLHEMSNLCLTTF